jgi:hypothetical protein
MTFKDTWLSLDLLIYLPDCRHWKLQLSTLTLQNLMLFMHVIFSNQNVPFGNFSIGRVLDYTVQYLAPCGRNAYPFHAVLGLGMGMFSAMKGRPTILSKHFLK